jgi:hypothetical protein
MMRMAIMGHEPTSLMNSMIPAQGTFSETVRKLVVKRPVFAVRKALKLAGVVKFSDLGLNIDHDRASNEHIQHKWPKTRFWEAFTRDIILERQMILTISNIHSLVVSVLVLV